MKVWVLGGPGCGKTTFAQELAAMSGARHVELDELFWRENWKVAKSTDFIGQLETFLAEPDWIVDGRFPEAVDRFLHLAEIVIWLDPPMAVAWPRLLYRTIARWLTRAELWAGNRESFISVFGSRSILWYAFRERAGQRKAIEEAFERLSTDGPRLVHTKTTNSVRLAQRIYRDFYPGDESVYPAGLE